jgi:hypothetical protein
MSVEEETVGPVEEPASAGGDEQPASARTAAATLTRAEALLRCLMSRN